MARILDRNIAVFDQAGRFRQQGAIDGFTRGDSIGRSHLAVIENGLNIVHGLIETVRIDGLTNASRLFTTRFRLARTCGASKARPVASEFTPVSVSAPCVDSSSSMVLSRGTTCSSAICDIICGFAQLIDEIHLF